MAGTEVGTAWVAILPEAKGFGSKLEQQIAGPSTRAGQVAGKNVGAGLTGGISGATAGIGGEAEKAGVAAGERAATGLSSSITRQAPSIGRSIAGAFAAVGALQFFRGSFAEAQEAAKVGALTDAVIKSTGGSAGVTAAQVGSLATSLSNLAGVDDEVIQGGENVLLTFTNVKNQVGDGNDVFNQATLAALNMSTAMGTDLQSSIVEVGKALQDPIQGVAALQRVGVRLTDQQKEQVKAFVASGDVLSAQKVILGELTKEFGGAAAAAATPADKARVAFKNLEETVGTAVMPLLNTLADVFAHQIAPAISAVVGAFSRLPKPLQVAAIGLVAIGLTAGPIGRVVGGIGSLIGVVTKLGGALLSNPWVLVAAAAVAAVILIVKNWGPISRFFERLWGDIERVTVGVWNRIIGFFVGVWQTISRDVAAWWGDIERALVGIWNGIVGTAGAVWNSLVGFFSGLWDTIAGGVVAAWNGIFAFFTGLPGQIISALGDVGSWLFDVGKAILEGLIHGLEAAVGGVTHAMSDIAGNIIGAAEHAFGIGSPSKVFFEVGTNVGQGFILGVRAKTGEAADAMTVLSRVPALRAPSLTGATVAGGALAGGGSVVIHNHLHDPVVRSDDDITKLARRLGQESARAVRAAGRNVSPLP